jgi:ribonuclease HI
MYFDGSFTLNGVRGGVVLISSKGDHLLSVIRLHFCATNNVVEYEALVNGLHIAVELGFQQLYIYGDSQLVINQVMGESNCHDSHMAAYQQEVRKLEEKFNGFELHHILRRDNEAVDALVWLGSSHEPTPPGVFTQDLFKSSIRLEEDVPICSPGTSPDKGTSIPIPGTPPRENGLTPTPDAKLGALVGPIAPSPGPEGEVAAVVRPPCPEVD